MPFSNSHSKLKRTTLSVPFLFFALVLFHCHSWQRNVTHHGIHFKKFRVSESGTRIGFLKNDRLIQNYPCKKFWIHFHKNWQLKSFMSSDTFQYKNLIIPKDTWVMLDESGNITICAFPENIEIQGYLCKGTGGAKGTQTSFYSSGKLKCFFSPRDIEVDGLKLKRGSLSIICVHENGNLKRGTLAEDEVISGVSFEKGTEIFLDENREVIKTK